MRGASAREPCSEAAFGFQPQDRFPTSDDLCLCSADRRELSFVQPRLSLSARCRSVRRFGGVRVDFRGHVRRQPDPRSVRFSVSAAVFQGSRCTSSRPHLLGPHAAPSTSASAPADAQSSPSPAHFLICEAHSQNPLHHQRNLPARSRRVATEQAISELPNRSSPMKPLENPSLVEHRNRSGPHSSPDLSQPSKRSPGTEPTDQFASDQGGL